MSTERPEPESHPVTLEALDRRLTHVERLLIEIHATQAPKWLRSTGWLTVIGTLLGGVIKALAEK